MAIKKTRGKQKIEIKKIENAEDRLCNELAATLCGAEVGVVVFSEFEKPYSYGHPSIESIADRFLNQQSPQETNGDNIASHVVGAYKQARITEILNKYNELQEKLSNEQLREKELQQREKARASEGLGWWQRPIKELDLEGTKENVCFLPAPP
ncbi:hypothetical protein ACLB2K_056101 [Fragaria x ananassa]